MFVMHKTNTNHNRVPQRRPEKSNGFRMFLAALAITGGTAWIIKDAVERNTADEPVTAYAPDSKAAQLDLAAYNARFESYHIDGQHQDLGSLAQEYAVSHDQNSQQPALRELEDQARAFNKFVNHVDSDAVYPGEEFRLPNKPHQEP